MNLAEDMAYRTMYAFLVGHYERSKSDDIGGLLGDLSLLEDGLPADPAVLMDWEDAERKAKSNELDLRLRLQ